MLSSRASSELLEHLERLESPIAHERKLGQTYLRVGNLVEAKKHLALAERMLELETPPQMDAATESSLDELKASKRDTFT